MTANGAPTALVRGHTHRWRDHRLRMWPNPPVPESGRAVHGANVLQRLLAELQGREPTEMFTRLPPRAWHTVGAQQEFFECQCLKNPEGDLHPRVPDRITRGARPSGSPSWRPPMHIHMFLGPGCSELKKSLFLVFPQHVCPRDNFL